MSHTECGLGIWLPAAAQAERAAGGREDRIFEQEIAEISKKRAGFHIEVYFALRTSHTECGHGHLVAGGDPG